MTIGIDAAPPVTSTTALRPLSAGAAVALGLVLAVALCWPRVRDIWATGIFYDTDDAMRMVEVRDWLAGQGWFDLVQHRLDPPEGLPMHWTRLVDLLVGGLVRLSSLALPPVPAERAARIAEPLLLQAALIAATVWSARALAGAWASLPAALLVVLSGIGFGQFQPGRIDHHSVQITLLMAMTGAMARGLSSGGERLGAVAGVALAASLGVSLENLPFSAVLVATPALAYAHGGERYRALLAWFGGALVLTTPAVFLAFVPPAHWGASAADTLSVAHLVAAVLGGVAFLGLTSLPPLRPATRWALVALAGALVLGIVALACPAALHDPYAGLDPLLGELWLSHVSEAQPLSAAIHDRPDTLSVVLAPVLLGIAALALETWRASGDARGRFALVLALSLVGLAGMAWEIRVATSVTPLVLLGGITLVARSLAKRPHPAMAPLVLATGLAFTPFAWAFVPMPEPVRSRAAEEAAFACRSPEALEPLAGLATTRVFAPIDGGSHLLANTSHSVFAAPYHRDNAGNLLVLHGFMADPEAASRLVRDSGAGLVALCPGQVQVGLITARSPGGLASALLAGRVPSWLAPMDGLATPWLVFRVRR